MASTGQQMSFARPPQSQGAPPTQSVSDMLSARPAASASAPSDTYVNLCKIVLQRRLRNMFVVCAATISVALYVTTFDPRQLPSSLYNVLPLLLFLPFAFAGALPVFILRKRTITTAPSSAATRFSQLVALRQTSAAPTWLAYTLGAAILSLSYVWCAGQVSRDAQLAWFVFHKGRDSYMLNERRVILSLLHATLAIYATFEHVSVGRSRVQFDDGRAAAIPSRLKTKALARIPIVVRSTLVSNALFYSAYMLLRRPVLRFVITSIMGSYARPFLYSMLRHNAVFSFTLALRSLASSAFIFTVWESAHVCFEVYATQPMLVSQFGSKPNQALVAGLRSSDAYYQSFAFSELASLTLTSPERRKDIFSDIRTDATRNGAWSEICHECLKLVGTELQRARRRGGSQTQSETAARSTAGAQQRTSSVPVKQDNVFLQPKKTFFDSLVSSASAAPGATSTNSATSAISSALSLSVTAASSRVPSIFQTGGAMSQVTAAQQAVAEPVQAAAHKVVNWEDQLSAWAPSAWRDLMFTQETSRTVEACVARRRETVWAIAALANLLCASLQEDPYGVAQRDIPRVLEGFVLYLEALEGLENSLVAEAGRSGKQANKEDMSRAIDEHVAPLQAALREGVREVVTEFEPYLSEFRFPPKIAARLQLLVDWG